MSIPEMHHYIGLEGLSVSRRRARRYTGQDSYLRRA